MWVWLWVWVCWNEAHHLCQTRKSDLLGAVVGVEDSSMGTQTVPTSHWIEDSSMGTTVPTSHWVEAFEVG